MPKPLSSFLLGLLSPLKFMIGAEFFEVRNTTSVKEILGGCLLGALYLAICQFFVAREGGVGLRACWPTLAAMDVPLLGAFVLIVVVERGGEVWSQGSSNVAFWLHWDPHRSRGGHSEDNARGGTLGNCQHFSHSRNMIGDPCCHCRGHPQ